MTGNSSSPTPNYNNALRILVISTCSAILLFFFLFFLVQSSLGQSVWFSTLAFFLFLLALTIQSAYDASTSYY